MNNHALSVYVFYCSNGLNAKDLAQCCDKLADNKLQTVSLPCSGKVNLPYLVKAFETGADGAVIVTCKQGECRHFEGNMRAHKRAEAVDSLLEEFGLGTGRMAVIQLTEGGPEQVIREVEDFCAKVRNLPQSLGQVLNV
jgi:F420-non-reducing hydrogenase iron-sulfur subunit